MARKRDLGSRFNISERGVDETGMLRRVVRLDNERVMNNESFFVYDTGVTQMCNTFAPK